MNCPIGRPKNRQAYKINRAFRKMGYEIKRCMKRGQYLVFCWAPVLAATIELEYEIPAFMFNTSITSDMRNHNRSAFPASCIAKKKITIEIQSSTIDYKHSVEIRATFNLPP